MTIDGGAGKNIISNGAEFYVGGNNVSIGGGSDNDTITNYGGSFVTINGGDGNDLIKSIRTVNYADYNQSTKKYETIETIYPANVTMIGGKGNDSLWGDKKADTFIYASGDGKDVIFGFDNKDTLTLDGLDFKASYKNDAIIFKVSGGSVTLQDFTAKTFHVNDDAYQIKGSKLVKQN